MATTDPFTPKQLYSVSPAESKPQRRMITRRALFRYINKIDNLRASMHRDTISK
jgi:hypothetical protein